jgi:DNA adenine methylase
MKGPLSYIGGKNRIAAQIIARFPKRSTYVEAFAGGAQAFFRKEPSTVEVINDLYSGELVNFFRVCQSHYQELIRSLNFILLSRKWYSFLIKTPPEILTDIQRAARYFIIQKCSLGGMVAGTISLPMSRIRQHLPQGEFPPQSNPLTSAFKAFKLKICLLRK